MLKLLLESEVDIMDLKNNIIKIMCDADLRQRFLKHLPDLFDNYYLAKNGEVLTAHELESLSALNYFLNGFDLINQAIHV